MGRLGIDVGDIKVLVHCQALTGQHYDFEDRGKMLARNTWDTLEIIYPLQAVVRTIDCHKKALELSDDNVEEVFKLGTTVFMLSTPYYGSQGTVVDPTIVKLCNRIKVNLTIYSEPDFNKVWDIHQSSKYKYINTYNAAAAIGISNHLLSRITGSIFIIPGGKRQFNSESTQKLNVGLQLRFSKNNEEVTGYTRKLGQWFYSPMAIELIRNYAERFPNLFTALSNVTESAKFVFFETELFPYNVSYCYSSIK